MKKSESPDVYCVQPEVDPASEILPKDAISAQIDCELDPGEDRDSAIKEAVSILIEDAKTRRDLARLQIDWNDVRQTA